MEKRLRCILGGMIVFFTIVLLANNVSYALVKNVAYDGCDHEYHPGYWSKPDVNGNKHWVSSYWSGNFTNSSPTVYWWFSYNDLVESASGNGNNKEYFCMYGGKAMRNSGKGWDPVKCGHADFKTRFWHTNVHYPPLDDGSSYTFTGAAACAMYNAMYDDDNKGATIKYIGKNSGNAEDNLTSETKQEEPKTPRPAKEREPLYKKKKKEIIKWKAIVKYKSIECHETKTRYKAKLDTTDNKYYYYEIDRYGNDVDWKKNQNGNREECKSWDKISEKYCIQDGKWYSNCSHYNADKYSYYDYEVDDNGNLTNICRDKSHGSTEWREKYVFVEVDKNGNYVKRERYVKIEDKDEDGNVNISYIEDENGDYIKNTAGNYIEDADRKYKYVYPKENGSYIFCEKDAVAKEYVLDENGNFIYETDVNGDPIYETDEKGNKIPEVELDKNGNPIKDEDGNPVYVYPDGNDNYDTDMEDGFADEIENTKPNEENYGKKGIQGAIWYSGWKKELETEEIGSANFSDARAKLCGFDGMSQFEAWYNFYRIEAARRTTGNSGAERDLKIIDICGTGNNESERKRGKIAEPKGDYGNLDVGLLPGEYFYVWLNFPIIYKDIPEPTTNGTVNTYVGQFGKMEITNGTLYQVPSSKTISVNGQYPYVVRINTGVLSSNKVEIKITKGYYNYSTTFKYVKQVSGAVIEAQPMGKIEEGPSKDGSDKPTHWASDSITATFDINSNVSINNYIESIDTFSKANQSECYNTTGDNGGKGGRKSWSIENKTGTKAVGELGDMIIYKIVISNYTKAYVYVDVKDIIPVEVIDITADNSASAGNITTWKRLQLNPSSNGTTPATLTLTVKGKISTRNYTGAVSTATITGVHATKSSGDTENLMRNLAKHAYGRLEEDSDWFITRKYDISIDHYISDVSHQETRGGTPTTYSSDARKEKSDDEKLSPPRTDPVFVEYGDIITYQLVLYNACYPGVSNGSQPYYTPGEVYVDFDFDLPKKYELKDVSFDKDSSYSGWTEGNGKIKFDKVKVDRNSKTTITVTLLAEEVTKYTTETTTMSITRDYNRNYVPNGNANNEIENLSGRIKTQEQYILSSYNAPLEEYIDSYNAEMAFYNDTYDFTENESQNYYNATNGATDVEGFESEKKAYSNNSPLELEKYETLRYKTIIRNQASGEAEKDKGSFKEYKTRVRPTEVKQTIDYGLTQYAYKIYWYHASTRQYEEVSNDGYQNRIGQTLEDTGSQWIYTYYITDENIILSPGDALFYLSYVEVTESNLCLENLKFKSDIVTLSNINRKNANSANRQSKDDRIVTAENLALYEKNDQGDSKTTYTNYVRLKDLIISGTVWVDNNRNGYYDNGEEGKDGIYVRLYGNINPDKPDEYVLVGDKIITEYNEKTKQHGYYNFGRVNKSWKDENGNYSYHGENRLISYFVEFEYYGQMYKATEVYGGMQNGETHGKGNLSIDELDKTISYWRQGYSDESGNPKLPQSQSITYKGSELGILGRTEYMIDSNAYEFDKVRYQFTEANRTIGYNKAYGIDTREGANGAPSENSLSYEKSGHNSTLNEEASTPNSQIGTRMTARSFITQSYQNEITDCDEWGKSKTNKNTDTLSLFNCSYSNSYNYPRAENQEKPIDYKTQREDIVETEYLKYINLGLVPREKIDLSMEADVYSVKTTINGEEMTYKYNANDADSTKSDYDNQTNAYRLNDAYDLDLYTTDYYYRTDYYKNEESGIVQSYRENGVENDLDKHSSELNTEVTYRVRITNNDIQNDEPKVNPDVMGEKDHDIPVETAINELTIYYDKNFMNANDVETVTVKEKEKDTGLLVDKSHNRSKAWCKLNGKEDNDNFSVKINTNDDLTPKVEYPNSGGELHEEYKVMYLEIKNEKEADKGLYLKEGEFVDVYITLTVDKETKEKIDRCLKITEDDDMGLELISEISAYTTRYKPNTNSENEDPNGYFHQGLAGKYAALVDRDSNPGNVLEYDRDNIDRYEEWNTKYYDDYRDYPNYEDDTYKVGIKVGLLDGQEPTPPPPEDPPKRKSSTERIITGMVWDDARSKEVKEDDGTAVQYLGNGVYDKTDENLPEAAVNPNTKYNNDKSVAGVKVSLIEVVQTQAVGENGKSKYYEYPARYTYDVYDKKGIKIHKKGSLIETRTDENGKYQLDHFIPGYYKVRFDYGYSYEEKDVEGNPILDTEGNPKITYYTTYNGQDYKSTTYYNQLGYYEELKYTDNLGSKQNFNYFDAVKDDLRLEAFSDAQDDEIRRLNVNSYSETMTALQAVVFAELENNKERLTRNTHMYAESAIFYVKPEDIESKETHIKPLDYSDFNKDRLWRIDNLDFGLEYRPEASILLDKEISTLELVTSDKKTLIKLYFTEDEDGTRMIDPKKSIGYENVQFLPNVEKTKQGFVYINMDTDILEGCTIKVDYEMTATNNSEVDRINQNLDFIKTENGASNNDEKRNYNKVYTTHHNVDNSEKGIEFTYNANATAAQLLGNKYYTAYKKNARNEGYDEYGYKIGYEYITSTGTEKYNYLNYLKKPYRNLNDTTTVENIELLGQEYYGMYLGQTYYTGNIGGKDCVAQLKVDHILDYVDNDFTFALAENNTKNRLWSSTTSDELYKNNLLDWNKVHNQKEGTKYYLIDRAGIRYDTDKKSNLALSVDDNKKGNLDEKRKTGNITLSRFLQTQHEIGEGETDTYGQISAVATKVISADDVSKGKGLAYENIAEVIQFTNITGRRTTLPKAIGENEVAGGGIIGNANVQNWTGANQYEDDTDATEIITISPPTGLTK